MRISTTNWRWPLAVVAIAGFASTAHAQRTVTLTLNSATIPDTTRTDSFMEVRGAVDGASPFTLADGNIIDWSDVSTLEPENIGGDYWRISFQIEESTDLTFKFYSQQAEDNSLNGWEADPNPNIPPGTGDTTLTVHFFESQSLYRGVSGDRGPYDWRPYEEKEDTVAVWFRVAMFGEEARVDGYDANSTTQLIGVRGGPPGGVDDWSTNIATLTRESTASGQPGHRIYSGVGYYPTSAVGQSQAYKFTLQENGTILGWEEGNLTSDRRFTVPAQDTTLQWVYYGNTAPVATEPIEALVIFEVDLSPLEEIGLFDRARGDTLWVYGSFNGWQDCPALNPDQCLMSPVIGEVQFELEVPMSRIPGTNLDYKYFLDFNDVTFREAFGSDPPSGWEEGHLTGIDRRHSYGDAQVQPIGLEFFNDVHSANVIPEGTSIDVNFQVDMSPALTNDAQPFDPAGGDSVFIFLGDPLWAFTQGYEDPSDDRPDLAGILSDPDGDNVYTGTLTVTGPTYSNLTFKYEYGQWAGAARQMFAEPGADTKTPGRNRTYFIRPNADGSWPSSYDLPEDTFQIESGPLPFEQNPALTVAVEPISDAIPNRIALEQNYPNPFNPSTTFEYAVTATQKVTIKVFDLMGREVATLVDGVQAAGTYRVAFDGSDLASGVYVYQLQTPHRVMSKKMLLVK